MGRESGALSPLSYRLQASWAGRREHFPLLRAVGGRVVGPPGRYGGRGGRTHGASDAHSSGHEPSFNPFKAPIGGSHPEAEGQQAQDAAHTAEPPKPEKAPERIYRGKQKIPSTNRQEIDRPWVSLFVLLFPNIKRDLLFCKVKQ